MKDNPWQKTRHPYKPFFHLFPMTWVPWIWNKIFCRWLILVITLCRTLSLFFTRHCRSWRLPLDEISILPVFCGEMFYKFIDPINLGSWHPAIPLLVPWLVRIRKVRIPFRSLLRILPFQLYKILIFRLCKWVLLYLRYPTDFHFNLYISPRYSISEHSR